MISINACDIDLITIVCNTVNDCITVMEMKNHNGNYHYYVFGEVLLNKILQSKKLLEEVIFKVPPYFLTLFSTL
jgi:fumarate hydratase class II